MSVLHAPDYISFQEQERPLPASDLSKIISHTLGVPSQSALGWNGLLQSSVFKKPKGNVLVTVVTTQDQPVLELNNLAKFPLDMDSPGVDINHLMATIQGSFMDKNPLMLDAAVDNNMFDVKSDFDVFRKLPNTLRKMADRLLDQDSVLHQHTTGSLNSSMTSDLKLMGELQMIQDVINTISSDDKLLSSPTPDLYSFTISGLQGVADKHGPGSQQVNDASGLVSKFLNTMTDNFKTIYKNNVVVEIIMITPQDKLLVRKVRSLKADDTPTASKNPFNLAQDYGELYPVMFNIILWMMILFAIAFFAVCYGIWNMDPGRDSIIYRMTTTRLKKD